MWHGARGRHLVAVVSRLQDDGGKLKLGGEGRVAWPVPGPGASEPEELPEPSRPQIDKKIPAGPLDLLASGKPVFGAERGAGWEESAPNE